MHCNVISGEVLPCWRRDERHVQGHHAQVLEECVENFKNKLVEEIMHSLYVYSTVTD